MRILDTDVCMELLQGNPRVIQHRQAVLDHVVTTWMTAAALFYRAANSTAPRGNRELVIAFLETLRVVGLSPEATERFGVLKVSLEGQNTQLTDSDLFIACIALSHRAILVSGNPHHYQSIAALSVENWL